MTRPSNRAPEQEPGQILVLFAIALTTILIALALLFDGAQSLVLRRQLQNTADAAALAGANIVQAQGGCTSALVSNTGSGNTIYTTVRQSVMDNLSVSSAGADALLTKADGTNGVDCATDLTSYSPYAVRVSLLGTSSTYFGNIAGTRGIGVGVTATAFNGPVNGGKFSVMQLDPCHNGTSYCESGAWPAQRNGCPSIEFNGGPTVTFEGSVQSDSGCRYDPSLSFTGSVGTSGSGNAQITLDNASTGQATIRMVGTYNPSGFSNISPTGQIYTLQVKVPDPLAGLPTPVAPTSGANAWLQCPSSDSRCPGTGNNKVNKCFVLSPGIYNGGIDIGSQGEVYMKPGIYIMSGGGLNFSGQGKIYTISSNSTYPAGTCSGFSPETLVTVGSTTLTKWEATLCAQAVSASVSSDVPTGEACGVLIYNKCSASSPTVANCPQNGSSPAFGPLDLSGGSGFRLRAFCASDATNAAALCTSTKYAPTEQQGSNSGWIKRYRNLVFWQPSQPAPTSSYGQPDMKFGGGGTAFLQGTVYAPNAFVKLAGNCGGSGGTEIDLTLQFISYDLQIAGSCTYRFAYRTNSFATPSGYGLVR